MEELYPGKAPGEGFHVSGFAEALPAKSVASPAEKIGRLIAGFHSFGRRSFFVYQVGATGDPKFRLRPLTTEFLANVIENDPTFKFSLVSERIGDVTYISGAQARDFGGEVSQGMISLHATGGWSAEGLKLNMAGELGDRSAFLGKPTPSEFKKASYVIGLQIPWGALRFMFYDQMGFVISNHQKYCTSASENILQTASRNQFDKSVS